MEERKILVNFKYLFKYKERRMFLNLEGFVFQTPGLCHENSIPTRLLLLSATLTLFILHFHI